MVHLESADSLKSVQTEVNIASEQIKLTLPTLGLMLGLVKKRIYHW